MQGAQHPGWSVMLKTAGVFVPVRGSREVESWLGCTCACLRLPEGKASGWYAADAYAHRSGGGSAWAGEGPGGSQGHLLCPHTGEGPWSHAGAPPSCPKHLLKAPVPALSHQVLGCLPEFQGHTQTIAVRACACMYCVWPAASCLADENKELQSWMC